MKRKSRLEVGLIRILNLTLGFVYSIEDPVQKGTNYRCMIYTVQYEVAGALCRIKLRITPRIRMAPTSFSLIISPFSRIARCVCIIPSSSRKSAFGEHWTSVTSASHHRAFFPYCKMRVHHPEFISSRKSAFASLNLFTHNSHYRFFWCFLFCFSLPLFSQQNSTTRRSDRAVRAYS